jgi:hypothetical protein
VSAKVTFIKRVRFGPQSNSASIMSIVVLMLAAASCLGYRSFVQRHAIESYRIEIPRVRWQDSNMTLVIAVRYGCPYCQASLPFYSRLIGSTSRNGRQNARVIFISPDNEYFASLIVPPGTDPGAIHANYPFPEWINGTPTVIAVDRSGRITGVWRGELTSTQEQSLLALAIAR